MLADPGEPYELCLVFAASAPAQLVMGGAVKAKQVPLGDSRAWLSTWEMPVAGACGIQIPGHSMHFSALSKGYLC